MRYKSARASFSAEVEVPADALFDAVASWLDILEVAPPAGPALFSHVAAAPGSQRGVLPCTRLLFVDKAMLGDGPFARSMPEYFAETLLTADKEAGTLVYRVEGDFLGKRNYYATEEIAPIGPGRCRATISSRFDLRDDEDEGESIASLCVSYENLIRGAERAVRRKLDEQETSLARRR